MFHAFFNRDDGRREERDGNGDVDLFDPYHRKTARAHDDARRRVLFDGIWLQRMVKSSAKTFRHLPRSRACPFFACTLTFQRRNRADGAARHAHGRRFFLPYSPRAFHAAWRAILRFLRFAGVRQSYSLERTVFAGVCHCFMPSALDRAIADTRFSDAVAAILLAPFSGKDAAGWA